MFLVKPDFKFGRLGNFCTISKATTNPGLAPDREFYHYSIPAFDAGGRPSVDAGHSIKSNKFLVPDNCILLSKLNPHTPRVWLPNHDSDKTAIASTEFLVLVPKDSVDLQFLQYVVQSPLFFDEMRGLVTGTSGSHQRVRPGDALNITVGIPNPQIQRQIGSFLGAIDERIAINQETNGTLEQIACAVFKSWFIDFDPVRAKANGEPTALPPGLDALFPSSFVEAEDGPLPAGWQMTTLAEQFQVIRGVSYTSAGLAEPPEGVPMHNLNSVREGGGYKESGLKWYSGAFKPQHEVKPGDVIVASLEQTFDHTLVGHAARVPVVGDGPMIFTQDLFKVDPLASSPLTTAYAYFLLNSDRMHRLVAGFANGTTIERIPRDALEMPHIVVPPRGLVQAFSTLADSVHEKVMVSKAKAKTLCRIRDTLLPRLVSGELQIPLEVAA